MTTAEFYTEAYDNCIIVTIESNQNDFDCSDIGLNDVMISATDEQGNVGTCVSEITVIDSFPPICNAADITASIDITGEANPYPGSLDNGSSDNCNTLLFSIEPSSFDCDDLGSNPVVLTVQDGSGNSSSCNASIFIDDPSGFCTMGVMATISGMVISEHGDEIDSYDVSIESVDGTWSQSIESG